MQAAAGLPAKPAKPVTEITAAAVADDPVNETVMEVGVDLKLLDNDIEAAIRVSHCMLKYDVFPYLLLNLQ